MKDGRVCAITPEEWLYCWGDTDSGITSEHVPGIQGVGLGWSHRCALLNGSITYTGACFHGECDTPKVGEVQWRLVGAARKHSCGVTTSDYFCCWGSNVIPDLECDFNYPPEDLIRPWTKIVVHGSGTVCGIAGTELKCWDGEREYQETDSAGWRDVATCGFGLTQNTCGVNGQGILWCSNGHPWETTTLDFSSIAVVDAVEPRICGILSNNVAICSGTGWEASEQWLNTHTWQSIYLDWAHTCGLTTNGEVLCWSPSIETPLHPDSGIDVRFAHLSGLNSGLWELCGYQYNTDRHLCIPLQGQDHHPPGEPGEAFIPIGDARWTSYPDADYIAPTATSVTMESVSGRVAISTTLTFPFPIQSPVAGEWRLFFIVDVPGPFPGFMTFDIRTIRVNELEFNPISISKPLSFAAASDSTLCVVNEQHQCWCTAPTGITTKEDVRHVGVSDSHVCVATTVGALECWGSDDKPFSELQPQQGFTYIQVHTSRNLTCALTSIYSVQCWGVEARVTPCRETFIGTGWLELVVKNHIVCGSHINGRLACPEASIRLPGLPTTTSVVQTVIGIGKTTSSTTSNTCISSESCITDDPAQAPYHNSLVVINDAEISSPIKSRLVYLGGRSQRTRSLMRPTLNCTLNDVTTACLSFPYAIPLPLRVKSLAVVGDGRSILLEAQQRSSITLEYTLWQVDGNQVLFQPVVAISHTEKATITLSEWHSDIGMGIATFNSNQGLSSDSGSQLSGGLVLSRVASVHVNGCKWMGLRVAATGSAMMVYEGVHSLHVSWCAFIDNMSGTSGGAITVHTWNKDSAPPTRNYTIAHTASQRNYGRHGGGRDVGRSLLSGAVGFKLFWLL